MTRGLSSSSSFPRRATAEGDAVDDATAGVLFSPAEEIVVLLATAVATIGLASSSLQPSHAMEDGVVAEKPAAIGRGGRGT